MSDLVERLRADRDLWKERTEMGADIITENVRIIQELRAHISQQVTERNNERDNHLADIERLKGALAAERERCAKEVDGFIYLIGKQAAETIAAAIRRDEP